jgi:hypothetical protein
MASFARAACPRYAIILYLASQKISGKVHKSEMSQLCNIMSFHLGPSNHFLKNYVFM